MGQGNDGKKNRNKDKLPSSTEEMISRYDKNRENSPEKVKELIHELSIHQAELEIRNEELKLAQAELEGSRNRYFDLYYSAPIAYLTITNAGLIAEINLRGCEMLGMERHLILKRPFGRFVLKEDKPVYSKHLERMEHGRTAGTCELRLAPIGSGILNVYMESIPHEDETGTIIEFGAALLDITELKVTEQKRLEAEQRFRILAENAPDFIAYFDTGLRYLYINPLLETLTGKDKSEFIGKTMKETDVPEGFRTILEGALRTVLLKGKGVGVEFSVPSARGVRIYHSRVFPAFSKDGHIEILMAIGNDITEQKRMEENLKKSNEDLETSVRIRTAELTLINEKLKEEIADREKAESELRKQSEILQTIIDNMPAMLCLDDRNGHTKMINMPFENLTGWTMEDARKDDFLIRVYPEADRLQEASEHWDKEGPQWIDLPMRTRDGRDLPGSWSRVKLSTGDQIYIGIDLTDRIKEEQERIRLAAAIEQSPVGLAIADSEGRIQFVNPSFEAFNDCRRSEALGKKVSAVLTEGQHQEWVKKEIEDAFASKGERRGTLERRNKTAKLELTVTIAPFRDPLGNIISYLIFEKNVTRERELERHLAKNQRMELIGTFAGGIVHDLNNILNPVIMNAEALLEEIPPESPVRPEAEMILEAGMRGKDLVRQILTFTTGKREERTLLKISSLVRESLKLIRAMLPATIEIRSGIPGETGSVMAEPTQIRQVVMNLISNAAHAIGDRVGVIEVKMDSITVDTAVEKEYPGIRPGSYTRLAVKDTGQGISKDDLNRIFEPFFTTKKPGEGTGLGLSVARRIIKGHGGIITASSRPGKGSTFQVLLPEA